VREGEGSVREEYSTCEGLVSERIFNGLLFHYIIVLYFKTVKEANVFTVINKT